MHLAGAMQIIERRGELDERIAKPRLVEGRGGSVLGRRRGSLELMACGVEWRRREVRRLRQHRPGGRHRQRHVPADVGKEVDAVDQLHREKPAAVFLDELAEPHEVRVPEIAHRAKLALDARNLVGADRAQGLDRHPRIPLEIDRLEDGSLSAASNLSDHAEAGKLLRLGGERIGLHAGR